MRIPAAFACVCGMLACAAYASTPTAWEMNSYRDFSAGRLSGLSLSRDGRLTLSPKIETVFASGQPIIWSLAQGPDGTLYAGTGHRGRLYRIDKAGSAKLLWTADQPEIFALAVDSGGTLYAATSPDGRIYRFENGKPREFFAPGTKYIWSLAFGRDGALYAGTGDDGRIFRIQPDGKGEVYYSTGQANITCLAFDTQGRLLAGSEPNGMLYRVSAKDKGFVLYDSTLPEIRTIVTAPDGTLYAAALGGSMSRRSLGGVTSSMGVPASASVSATSATITVEADAQDSGIDIKPKADTAKPAASTAATATAAAPSVVDVTGVEKSAIYRINPDNTVESLWSSKEEDAYDLLVSKNQITFSTDGQGRIYALSPERRLTLITQTNEGEAIRLIDAKGGIVAATGDMGKIYRLTGDRALAGSFEAPVHDANTVARWGRMMWRADVPSGARLVFRTRTGNSMRPDQTWSDWSDPLTDPKGSPVASPNARYIQWKAELSGSPSATPVLDSVDVAYLPQNNPPVVKSINVTAQSTSGAAAAAAKSSQAASAPAYTVTVTDTPDAAATSAGTPTQNLGRAGSEQLQVTWQADDPDGDRMVYSLYFRGEDEREWKLLKSNLSENTYSIDGDTLADGRYLFRVVASDSPANPPSAARSAELVSSPTLVDHTPPVVTLGAPRRDGSRIELEFSAVDAASPIRRCEYSLDATPWIPLDPLDGILDSPSERFVLKLDSLPPGEHLIVVRAVDSAGNTGLAKVVVR